MANAVARLGKVLSSTPSQFDVLLEAIANLNNAWHEEFMLIEAMLCNSFPFIRRTFPKR
ncbi:hypothetical protein [Nitrincola sp.]|uniref:hypothetical protein n=1 Tax=Nitrincola sp. TaxID=1926584 RepID=UPI003A93AD45